MPTAVPTAVPSVVEQFLACVEEQRFAELGALYTEDAVVELLVGAAHEERKGREAIVAGYAADHHPPPVLLRWSARTAPWGAVVEGDALQAQGAGRVRFRWVHVLIVEDDRIATDTVYCTGAVPCDAVGLTARAHLQVPADVEVADARVTVR